MRKQTSDLDEFGRIIIPKEILEKLSKKEEINTNPDIKELLDYALNEKPKYDEVYKYIKNNIVEPVGNAFINQKVLYTNIEQLYTRAINLERIIQEIAKEE